MFQAEGPEGSEATLPDAVSGAPHPSPLQWEFIYVRLTLVAATDNPRVAGWSTGKRGSVDVPSGHVALLQGHRLRVLCRDTPCASVLKLGSSPSCRKGKGRRVGKAYLPLDFGL